MEGSRPNRCLQKIFESEMAKKPRVQFNFFSPFPYYLFTCLYKFMIAHTSYLKKQDEYTIKQDFV